MLKQKAGFNYRGGFIDFPVFLYTNVAGDTVVVSMRCFSQARRKDSRARGADRSKRAPTTLGHQMYSRNGGHLRHFLGNIMGYVSHSHINDCLFQSNIACF